MMEIGEATLLILTFLLPGLLGILLYEQISEGDKLSNSTRVVAALCLTIISIVATSAIYPISGYTDFLGDPPLNSSEFWKRFRPFSSWSIAISVAISCGIAVFFSTLHNYGVIYWIFRKIRLTKKGGTVDVWQQIFRTHRGIYILITFDDGVKLLGYPRYYSDNARTREIFLADAAWAVSDGERIEIPGPGVYIHNFDRVLSIEIVRGEHS